MKLKNISNISNKELKSNIIDVLNHEKYIPNKYTEMIESIIKNDVFSKKQKDLLFVHMKLFYESLLAGI